jgi:hypothetical protein
MPSDLPRTGPRFLEKAGGAALLAITLLAMLAMLRKGLWYDEAWSLFMARHPDHWLYDAHPPLFYHLSALFEPASALAGRLLNLLYLGIAAVSVFALARPRPEARRALTIAAVVLLANPVALYAVIDFRSYALLLAAWGTAVASFLAVSLDERDFEPGDWPTAVIGGVGIVLALNIQYFSALLVGTMLGVFIVSEWVTGQRRWAVMHFLAAALGSAFLLATMAVHYPFLQKIAQLEWTKSLWGAIKIVASVMLWLFCSNLVGLLAAIRLPGRFAVTCAVAIVAAILVALAANTVHGILLWRYLMPLAPVAAALIAVQSRRMAPWLYAALLANALIVAGVYLMFDPRRNWEELGQEIGSIVRSCPSTMVVTLENWRMAGLAPYPLRDQKQVLALGQGLVGREYGFELANGPASPSRCPVVVWTEHYRFPIPKPAEISARAGVPGTVVAIKRSETGFIAVLR